MGNTQRIRRLQTRALLWFLFSALFPAISMAQGSDLDLSAVAVPSNSTILVHSDLVLIPVTVTDRSGTVVNGLQKEHFTLFEDKVPQVITHFGAEDSPASIGLLFDISQSMGPKIEKAREAVAALLRQAHAEDEFFLAPFSSVAELAVPMTNRRDVIQRRVDSLKVGGTTALLDALMLGMEEMKKARHERKAIVIISDGEDNASRRSLEEFKAAVREGDTVIYAIGIDTETPNTNMTMSQWQRMTGSAFLREITEQTGGRLIEVSKPKQLPVAASRIGEWLRRQYVLGYTPNSATRNGAYHRIEVKLSKPKGFPRLHAYWRLGYYAPAE